MCRWLDAYLAESAGTPASEEKNEKGPYGVLTKPTKPPELQAGDGSVSFVSASGHQFVKNSAPADRPKCPLFYTDTEREAARRDAERLGYGGRT